MPAPINYFSHKFLKPTVIATFATFLMASLGVAATPEDDYLAARQSHYTAIRAAEAANKSEDELDKLDESGREDLKARLLAILGPSTLPHASATPVYQPDTLLDGMVESGGVDGLRYSSDDGDWIYLVTTDKLIMTWAKEQEEGPKVTDVRGLFASDDFFTYALGGDAAFMPYLELPVDVGSGAVGRAIIGTFAQDTPNSPPDTLVMAVSRDQRVVVAVVPAKTAVSDPKECSRLKSKQDERYIGCVAKALKKSPQFAELTQEAQQLLDSAGKAPKP